MDTVEFLLKYKKNALLLQGVLPDIIIPGIYL